MSGLRLLLLGPPRLERDGVPLELGRRKAVALLAYLAVTGQAHSRETLATLFWPDFDHSRGRASLRRVLAALNKALGGGWLVADREKVELDRSAKRSVWLDVEQFQGWLSECGTHGHPTSEVCPACLTLLIEAVALYRADFLAGFTLPDCLEFDEWQFFQTESLRQDLASALERLVRGHIAQGDFEAAMSTLAVNASALPAANMRRAVSTRFVNTSRFRIFHLLWSCSNETGALAVSFEPFPHPDVTTEKLRAGPAIG